jgi:hypothetical protein
MGRGGLPPSALGVTSGERPSPDAPSLRRYRVSEIVAHTLLRGGEFGLDALHRPGADAVLSRDLVQALVTLRQCLAD